MTLLQIQSNQEQDAPAKENEKSLAQGRLWTFKEAMEYLRVSRSSIYRLMWSGELEGHKVGGTWRFYEEDLRDCVKAVPMRPPEIQQAPVQRQSQLLRKGMPHV